MTREYYKDKGVFGEESHENYFKPEQYFKDRNKAGRVGLTVYGCMLVIVISDILLSFASVYICRDLTLGHGQVCYLSSSYTGKPHRIGLLFTRKTLISGGFCNGAKLLRVDLESESSLSG